MFFINESKIALDCNLSSLVFLYFKLSMSKIYDLDLKDVSISELLILVEMLSFFILLNIC